MGTGPQRKNQRCAHTTLRAPPCSALAECRAALSAAQESAASLGTEAAQLRAEVEGWRERHELGLDLAKREAALWREQAEAAQKALRCSLLTHWVGP